MKPNKVPEKIVNQWLDMIVKSFNGERVTFTDSDGNAWAGVAWKGHTWNGHNLEETNEPNETDTNGTDNTQDEPAGTDATQEA